jgi:hypothetical protein
VVVAVIAIRVMEMSVNEIVDVVSMRNDFVAAVCAVLVRRVVSVALVSVGAIGGICEVHFELMLIDVTVVKRMQMAIMQIISVVVVDDCGVAAVFAVLMRMVLVDLVLI